MKRPPRAQIEHEDISNRLPDEEQEALQTRRAIWERLTTIRARLQQSQRELERIMDWLVKK